MAPKKDGKKKEEEKPAKGGFTEVDKTFMELQLVDCNRKVARLRAAVDDYEQRNEELQKAYDKLDEDRADIIAYLKKTLNVKTEENSELKEKVRGLEETREIETAQFKETVTELEKNFTTMKDQLTSENKLLAGKLNTLEEFRAIRDDLMKKFENQEQDFKDQEMKYKRIIYDAEKKFIIGKDKLKKEMEARLLQLAQDFQDATELRIAASTHRVIRENIAINNELDSILSTQAKLADLNDKYKESERASRIAKELAEEERDKAINKNVVQLKVIDQLTNAFQEVKKERALYEKKNYDSETLQAKIQKLTKENENLSLQVRILEQNLHAKMSDQNKAIIESTKIGKQNSRLKKILKEAAIAVQAALKLDEWATTDPSREIMDRQILLSRLLEIVTQYREVQRAESVDTLTSFGKIYEEGDLGFMPKPTAKRSVVAASEQSKESFRPAEKRSSPSLSISSSSLGSIKTIPSMKLMPHVSAQELRVKDSLQSFVTSTKSSESSSAVEQDDGVEGLTDVEKMLAASKLEMQKSILKDLAFSVSQKSQMRIDEHRGSTSKSVLILETIPAQDAGEVMEGSIVEGAESTAAEDEGIEGEKIKPQEVKSEAQVVVDEEKSEDVKTEEPSAE